MASMILQTWQLVVVALAGWMNQQQQDAIAYLREENHVLREQLGGKRIRFTDDQRRRLAAKGKALGSKVLREVCTLVTPETLLRW
jgi:putative transposase